VRRGSGPGALRVASSACAALLAVLAAVTAATGSSADDRLAPCLACHGADGQSRVPETPSLGGQPAFFVIAQLFLFREGRRAGPAMTQAAKALTDDDLRALAARIAALPPPPPPADASDPDRFARGRALATRHPCAVCHNPDYSGREQMPRLANQREDYLLKAMREYRSGARLGYGGAMAQELAGLGDDDLRDLAHFLAHLPGQPR
jgi:cytochrome c553